MNSKAANVFTFLTALILQVAVVWQDAKAPVVDKILLTVLAGAGLALSKAKLADVEQKVLAGLVPAGTILSLVYTHFQPGSKCAAAISIALTIVSSAQRILTRPTIPPVVPTVILVFLGMVAFPSTVRADALVLPLSDTVTCSPVGMLTGYQYNLSTKDFQKGVALGAGVGCRWTGWKVPLGINLVGGAGININAPNAAQGSLVFTVADNYGVACGAQVFNDPLSGDRTYQGLVSFFLGASWAATVEQLATAKARAVQQAREAAAAKVEPGDHLTIGDF